MIQSLSTTALLTWFLFGFFMSLGWSLAAWLVNRLLSRI